MEIPNQAIDAAYEAWWAVNAYPGMDRADANSARDEIRHYLEVAAPHIVAQELREAAAWIECKEPHGDRHHEYLSANREDVYQLQWRAHELEQQ